MEQPKKLSKKEFLKQEATPVTKRHAKTTTVLTFLCIALMFFSLYLSYVTSVEELPMVASILELGGQSVVSELKNELNNAALSFDLILNNADASITPEVEAYFNEFGRLAKELANKLSLQNMQKFGAHYANVPDALVALSGADTLAIVALVETIINGIVLGVAIALAFPMLFIALGGFCRNTALAVIGMILSIGITLALFMTPLFLLYQLMQIILIVFISKVNKAYKAYKRAPFVPAAPAEPVPAAE